MTGLLPVHPETWKRLRARKSAAPKGARVLAPDAVYAKAYADVYTEDNPAPVYGSSHGGRSRARDGGHRWSVSAAVVDANGYRHSWCGTWTDINWWCSKERTQKWFRLQLVRKMLK